MSEELYEKCYDIVHNHPVNFLPSNKKYSEEFFDWLDENFHEEFQAMLNKWLETKEGQAFLEKSVCWLMENKPEPDREQMEDR